MNKDIENIISWMKEKVNEANSKGVIFGLSGGIDSAVVAGLSVKAFGENALGVIMPSHSNPQDEKDALLIAEKLGLKTKKVDLSETYEVLLKSINYKSDSKLALANIKPRLRMTTLYYLAQELGYLVVGPTNKSEFVTGYFTKHGDSGVDILPIASYVKEDIFKMAELLNIPKEIINKKPSAGLWDSQTDEEEMGFSYFELDKYILTGEGEEKLKEKVDKMDKRSEHKRNYPPIYIPK